MKKEYMRMKAIELMEKLKTKPVFTIQDIERIAYYNKDYAKQIMNRLKKRKLIKKIRRNTHTTQDNIYLIAANITYPSYISFWSASCFLEYTEQIINTIHIATTRRIKPVKFKNYEMKNPIAASCRISDPLGNEPLIFIKRCFMVFCIYAQR